MQTLASPHSARQEIRKSRFLAVAGPVASEMEAKAFIASHSDPSATHNCWAWRVGQAYRFNDDGEPGGTAGKPILQAIDGQELNRVAVLVVRWFGGVLLGSGGLVRAYGGTAAMALREAEKLPILVTTNGHVDCAFGDLAILTARIETFPSASIANRSFGGSGARLVVAVAADDFAELARLVADATAGRAILEADD